MQRIDSNKTYKIPSTLPLHMDIWYGYGNLLIYAGEILALVGIVLVAYSLIRERMKDRVETGRKPTRKGLPYPDLYYWHILQQRTSVARRIKRAIWKERSHGV